MGVKNDNSTYGDNEIPGTDLNPTTSLHSWYTRIMGIVSI